MNKTFYGAASITCSQRSKILNTDFSQGPASYDLHKQKCCNSLPKWTLKPRLDHGSAFKKSKQNVPPPGAYQVTKNMKHKVTLKNPNFRSQKHKGINQKVAHVSHLNIPSTLCLKKGSVFGYRQDNTLAERGEDCSPGPIYHTTKLAEEARCNKIKNTCRGFGFGEKNCIYRRGSQVPDPGSYYIEASQPKSVRTSPTFGKSKRNLVSNTCPLGPGQYNPNYTNSSFRSFKLKGKLPQAARYQNPNGPGAYDLPDTRSKVGPIFNHRRYKSNNSQFSSAPDPCTYDFKRYPENNVGSKAFSLGKKIDLSSSDQSKNPGPGSYRIQEDLAKMKLGGYMGRKAEKKKKIIKEDVFGKYDPKYQYTSKGSHNHSFAQNPKPWDRQQKEEMLGPGYYNLLNQKPNESYSIGKAKRFKELKKQGVYAYREKQNMYSTIGFMPSYLKNNHHNKSKTMTNKLHSSQTASLSDKQND